MTKKDVAISFINKLIDDIEKDRYTGPKFDGRKTKYGITERFARTMGFKKDVRSMTRNDAIAMYYVHFFVKGAGGRIIYLSEKIAYEWFEQAVNTGSKSATKRLQRALNAINVDIDKESRLTPDLSLDGKYGAKSHELLKQALMTYNDMESVLLKKIDSLQSAFYTSLAEGRLDKRKHSRGWENKRIDNI